MMYDMQWYEVFSLRFWSKIWSTYSLYDPSYSNPESFGFFVDVGNGWTTLIPTLVFLYSMTYHNLIGARWLGLIGLIKFYQEFYGTCIYFLSFFLNQRHVNKSVFEVVMFVGFSNGLWFFFPLIGMYASYHLIETNSYAIFHWWWCDDKTFVWYNYYMFGFRIESNRFCDDYNYVLWVTMYAYVRCLCLCLLLLNSIFCFNHGNSPMTRTSRKCYE